MNTILTRVKTILGLEFEIDYDDILLEIINNITQMVNLYVNAESLPEELEFIVVESSVARYLRRGSEGLDSESMGEISFSYQEILTPYLTYLDTYKSTSNKVKFL